MVKISVLGVWVLVAAVAAKKGLFWSPVADDHPGASSVKLRCLEEIRPCAEGGLCSETSPGIYTCCPCIKEEKIFGIESDDKLIDTKDIGTIEEPLVDGIVPKARHKATEERDVHRHIYGQMWSRDMLWSLDNMQECYLTPHPVQNAPVDNAGSQHLETCSAEISPGADLAINLRAGVNIFRLVAQL